MWALEYARDKGLKSERLGGVCVRDVEGPCVCAGDSPRMGARVGEVVGCCEEDDEGTRVGSCAGPGLRTQVDGEGHVDGGRDVQGRGAQVGEVAGCIVR